MYLDVTKQDSYILVPYIDNKNSKDYLKYHTLSSGIVVSGKEVYSVSEGIVILAGQNEDGYYTVIIQYNVSQCFSYCLLEKCFVSEGNIISKGTKLGTCKNKMRFEYLTESQDNSIWAIRVQDLTYYAQDPMNILNRTIKLDSRMILGSGYNIQTTFRSSP